VKTTQLKALVSECVKGVLDEVRSTPGNPNVFWLVTTVNPNVTDKVEDLASGELHGITGISDNNRILMHWLGIGRNAVLIMKASHLMNDNQGRIDRIDYESPDELTYDNMALLRRIYNADDDSRGNRRITDNIWQHMYDSASKPGWNETMQTAGRLMRDGYISKHDVFDRYANQELEINSPKELGAYLKLEIDKAAAKEGRDSILKIPEGWWADLAKRAIKDSVRTYSSEGEWVVDSPSLKIPAGSRLLVAVDTPLQDFPEAAQAKLMKGETPKLGVDIDTQVWTSGMRNSIGVIKTVFEYGLDKRYKVKFIDLNKFKVIQNNMQVKHTYG